MEKVAAIFFLLTFLFLLFQIMRHLFLKVEIHFRLLKELYPRLFEKIDSLWRMMWSGTYFKLGLDVAFWFSCPFYYSKFPKESFGKKSLFYHNQLIDNNRKVLLYILLYLIYMALLTVVIYYFQ